MWKMVSLIAYVMVQVKPVLTLKCKKAKAFRMCIGTLTELSKCLVRHFFFHADAAIGGGSRDDRSEFLIIIRDSLTRKVYLYVS